MSGRGDPRERLRLPAGHAALALAERVGTAGGRALLVGGWVRDRLLGRAPRDLDIEVFGLDERELERALGSQGRARRVGRAHPVWRIAGLDADITAARGDFPEAARRRDLTINSMGWDPLGLVLLDPWGGRADVSAGTLRATDPTRFGDDPLRALRVARLAAELEMEPEPATRALCAAQEWAGAAAERIREELSRLLGTDRPSRGLALLAETGQLRHLPPLEALRPVPQDPRWHPEGDVWHHTVLAVDVAASLRTGDPVEDGVLLWSALCHDLGKPGTTVREGGRVRSRAHDKLGERIAREWLAELRHPNAFVDAVAVLVRAHLAPALLHGAGAGDRAYRRLVRRLDAARVGPLLLERLARADHWGRTTEEARARVFPAGDALLTRVDALAVRQGPPPQAVRGRDLMARGIRPGPEMGRLLERCREVQDETGLSDAEAILERVLGGSGPD